ncbi:26S proteasome non-ATPase regulatory subunit 11B-like [Limanda limanda]|uniref:26S proteasome non-ATPase regulatory subunit 11B-like n=1 Tax=Limanda limanda TaxID=27771 RepID=UPI0029C615F6|nr:26S proteasome non-ATPase regulatory subunit 11B-like [Limanda limanda]
MAVPQVGLELQYEEAVFLSTTDLPSSIDILNRILYSVVEENNERDVSCKVKSFELLGKLLADTREVEDLERLLICMRPFLISLSKAKIRQVLEIRLIRLYFDTKRFEEALALCRELFDELKGLDHTTLLVEVQLLERETHHALNSLPMALAAVTSARTTADAIICPPNIQAAVDMHTVAGILHAEKKEWTTALLHFTMAFDTNDCSAALAALRCMLLCKIFLNEPQDVPSLVSSKMGLRPECRGASH